MTAAQAKQATQLEKWRIARNERRLAKKMRGECRYCPKRALPGVNYCEPCKLKKLAYNEEVAAKTKRLRAAQADIEEAQIAKARPGDRRPYPPLRIEDFMRSGGSASGL